MPLTSPSLSLSPQVFLTFPIHLDLLTDVLLSLRSLYLGFKRPLQTYHRLSLPTLWNRLLPEIGHRTWLVISSWNYRSHDPNPLPLEAKGCFS